MFSRGESKTDNRFLDCLVSTMFETIAPNEEKEVQYHKAFQSGFVMSAASASYQVEGAWNENSKLLYINK